MVLNRRYDVGDNVTPHVGVWIETPMDKKKITYEIVTPHVGVWIETA